MGQLRHLARWALSVSLLVGILSVGCTGGAGDGGDSGAERPGLADAQSSFAGLAFTTVDRSYSASQLWFNDFATGNIKSLSTGEGSDPWLADLSGQLYLFNRGTNLNFRAISSEGGAASAQLATPAARVGDPHAALALDDTRVLLAHNTAGKLIIIDRQSGELIQDLSSHLDTGDGPFHPEALQLVEANGSRTVYVLHQGFSIANNTVTLNGTSAVFSLSDQDDRLTPIDHDDSIEKIQGIKITNANPQILIAVSDKLWTVGSCSSMIAGSCKATIEVIDTTTNNVTELFDFTDLGFSGNGPVVDGGEGRFFANMVESSSGTAVIAEIDSAKKTIKKVHAFPATSFGCCATYFDKSSETLYVGDAAPDSDAGILSVYRSGDAAPTDIAVDGRPYTAVFLSR